jgi:DNA repair protein RAD5
MPKKKYIGAFGVGAWATRSGNNLIFSGEMVRIERHKNISKLHGIKKASTTRRKTQDIVVRFHSCRGQEIGRLPQETAEFVSTLMDQSICAFEGFCVFAPEGGKIKTNDTIFLQLRCYLRREAFHKSHLSLVPEESLSKPNRFSAARETEEEKDMRLRQLSLVKLLAEINLEPVNGSSNVSQKQKRTVIIQSIEEGSGLTMSKSNSQDDDKQEDEGNDLEQDQLDALYGL